MGTGGGWCSFDINDPSEEKSGDDQNSASAAARWIGTSGRTGADELVPSRYALRVGEIDVLVISDGVFSLPASTLATNADLAAWLDDRLQPPDVYKWPLNVVVVRSGGRTVLIDAGVGSEFPDFPGVGRLAMRLDVAGIDPASVTEVVLTHLQ